MKNIIIFLIFSCLLTACQNEKKQFVIEGKVSNNSKDYALFVQDTTGIGISNIIDTVNIDINGNFSIKNKPLKANSSLIFNEERPVRLTIPTTLDSSIKIVLDFSEPDLIKIKGEQASLIKFYLDQQNFWVTLYEEMSDKHPELAAGNNQTINFHKIQDTITNLRIKYLEKYFKNSKIINQEDFIISEKNSLIYSNLYYRMSGQKSDIVKRLKFYQKSDRNSSETLTYSDKVSFSDKSLFSNQYYREFINNVIMDVVRFENPDENLSSYELYLNKGMIIIDNWFKNPDLRKIQKIIFINHLISNAKAFRNPLKFSEFQKKIEKLKNSRYANENLPILEQKLRQLESLISKFSAGKKAPDFELESLKGKLYKSSDFENKLMFIDVWASWCGPCISSFPKWNKLIEDYSNSNEFVFLSVSMDKDKNKWISSIEKFNLKGLKLHVGSKEFDSEFAKSFDIKSLPNYIAIDGKGNIISVSSSFNDFQELVRNKLSEK
ncbi:TlpA family protein disulfide reductase [Salegentibacter echinorum]|nr:TlpA disulfide reductase family protein [Salegentibacter echinorum]